MTEPDKDVPDSRRIGTLLLYELRLTQDFAGLKTLFHTSIPNDRYRKNELANFEGCDTSIFYSHFAALGLAIHLIGAAFSKTSRNIVDV